MKNRTATSKPAFSKTDILALLGCAGFLLMNLGLISTGGRVRAKQAVCRSNVRYLANAWLAFAEDHDGQLVGGSITNQPGAWVLPPSPPSLPTKKYAGIINGALYPYVGAVGLYRCPANSMTAPFCTYSIPGGANGEHWTGYVPATRYSELKTPATRYIFLEEIDPRGYNVGSWVMDLQSNRWIDPLLIWHNNRTTLGFADGHAETRRWVDKSLIDWCSMALEDPGHFHFGMTPPPDEREDIEYMANGFPCKSLGDPRQ
ncbi:MAG: hypothetical protein KAY65_11270 [Planctomycetes bacterium]|nr:hypothetical protein [Planctomycetota bacterium]